MQGLASTDHTTLLLNCYAKLKDIDKLDTFLRAGASSGEQPSLQFDVDTAIKVQCKNSLQEFSAGQVESNLL